MSGDGDRSGKSSGGLLRPSLEDSKVMRWAIREGEPSWPLDNEVTQHEKFGATLQQVKKECTG